jgi:hypothetical protein
VVFIRYFTTIAWLLLSLTATALADKRVALIVGNSAYRNIAPLENPSNDARLMADTLRSLGFALVGGAAQVDIDKAGFDALVQRFGDDIQSADVALFYFAGHGLQVSGANYLVPVNANPTREADVDFQMLDVNLVLRQMQHSGTRLNLVILDACRNNPFAVRGLRAAEGGLAQMRAPEGTLISYATQPGNVARDGSDGHSPYSKALAQTLQTPGLGIFDAFNQVGLAVKRETGGAQQPWVSSSPIDGAFYFAGRDGAAPTPAPPPAIDPLPRVAVVSPPKIPPAAPAPTTQFDGAWMTTLSCNTASGALGYSYQFTAQVKNGHYRGEHGTPGQPGSIEYDGTIAPDGTIDFYGKGLTGSAAYTVGQLKPGTEYGYHVTGHLEAASGTATRADGRPCSFTFAKRGR